MSSQSQWQHQNHLKNLPTRQTTSKFTLNECFSISVGISSRTHYWEDWNSKKPSTQRDLNPQPLNLEGCALPLCPFRMQVESTTPTNAKVFHLTFRTLTLINCLQETSFGDISVVWDKFSWDKKIKTFRDDILQLLSLIFSQLSQVDA